MELKEGFILATIITKTLSFCSNLSNLWLLLFVCLFLLRVSLCSLGCHITSSVDQTGLRSLLAFIHVGLKLKYTHGVCSAESSFNL